MAAKEHEMATSVVDQTKQDQTHSSMMAWRVHEFGPPSVMRFEQVWVQPYPLAGAREAHFMLERVWPQPNGKIVLTVGAS